MRTTIFFLYSHIRPLHFVYVFTFNKGLNIIFSYLPFIMSLSLLIITTLK